MNNIIQPKGEVELIIDHENGKRETFLFKNTILANGRQALAKCLANEIGDSFSFYIDRMVFGSGGTISPSGTPKYVNAERSGLYTEILSKPVIASIDPNQESQVVFTSVILSSDFTESTVILNEMGLKMNNDELYSMVTFPNVSKTNTMQLTWNWRISFV